MKIEANVQDWIADRRAREQTHTQRYRSCQTLTFQKLMVFSFHLIPVVNRRHARTHIYNNNNIVCACALCYILTMKHLYCESINMRINESEMYERTRGTSAN